MLEKVLHYITTHQLASAETRILAAVSGGLDSVVLADVLHRLKFPFAVLHCNFGLRGEESEADELFVRKLAKQYDAPFYSEQFQTQAFAEQEGISTQMAARTLRYQWFEQMRQQLGYDLIATAHHQSDALETVLLNLVRGTGLAGLHGILPKNGNLIRPLLGLTKDDLYDWLVAKRLAWREDSSNESRKYNRNLVRHEVIPVLKKLNPNLEETFTSTLERLQGAEAVFQASFLEMKAKTQRVENGATYLSIAPLQASPAPVVLLHELLKPFHFSYSQAQEIAAAWEAQSGKTFSSPTHVLVKDREDLVITAKPLEKFGSVTVPEETTELRFGPYLAKFNRKPAEGYKVPRSKDVAALDADLVKFPLKLRPWKEGDWFIPLGMNGKKKVSDLLIDRKIPANLKPDVWVLVSDASLTWVLGQQLDNRFKVTENTQQVLEITVTRA
ncbi:tRNA lysidine(34) synthetase TilS [Rufibacter latericius]|uniref:tRNA(Ile)-lysidine synthase n=1 Tax=Rufibacter latericius TaxID=2487040 RepID=A0A3M9N199_9BACT|nr:tRNA lysidine(34) synthetase TilS [Rufibacter latericius]RNI31127.1 tRNA lysidine(34) synthetase TilS [Rufibacter latericius]